MEMAVAVNLLRCRRQELGGHNWKPQYRVVGDMVELTGVEVRIMARRSSLPPMYDMTVIMANLTRCPSSPSPQLAIDASFRHRNGRAQGASIIQSEGLGAF